MFKNKIIYILVLIFYMCSSKIIEEPKLHLKIDNISLKRFGQTEDVANFVCFLASALSSYITGQTFHVNGGMLMG